MACAFARCTIILEAVEVAPFESPYRQHLKLLRFQKPYLHDGFWESGDLRGRHSQVGGLRLSRLQAYFLLGALHDVSFKLSQQDLS